MPSVGEVVGVYVAVSADVGYVEVGRVYRVSTRGSKGLEYGCGRYFISYRARVEYGLRVCPEMVISFAFDKSILCT